MSFSPLERRSFAEGAAKLNAVEFLDGTGTSSDTSICCMIATPSSRPNWMNLYGDWGCECEVSMNGQMGLLRRTAGAVFTGATKR